MEKYGVQFSLGPNQSEAVFSVIFTDKVVLVVQSLYLYSPLFPG
jgi:hypothetical protein